MLNWEKSTSGASKTLLFAADAHTLSEAVALREVWQLVSSEILPLNASVNWNYIRVEIWADSGRLIIFPANSQSKFRIEAAVCQIFIPSLLEESEQLDEKYFGDDDTEELPDDEVQDSFSQARTAMELGWIRKAEEAARAELIPHRALEVIFYSGEKEQALHSFTLDDNTSSSSARKHSSMLKE